MNTSLAEANERGFGRRGAWLWASLLLIFAALAACITQSDAQPAQSAQGQVYQGDGLTVTLISAGDGAYTGTIELKGVRCPLNARATGATLGGTFTDNAGNPFAFTATLEKTDDGMVLSLTTGGKTFHLRPEAEAPAPQTPAVPPAQPAAQAPPTRDNDAGEHTYTITPDTMSITLMPELKTAPAPAWVKPGLRITMHRMDGTIAGARFVLTPTANGGWINKATGEHFSIDQTVSGAGDGLLQVDVVAVHKDGVALNATNFIYDGMQRLLALNNVSGVVTTPSVSACWINPDVLHKYADINGPGVESYKTRFDAIGKTFNALWRSVGDPKSNTTYVYDFDSGLRLHDAMCVICDPSTVNINGIPQNVGGQTNLAQGTLVELRQVTSPWTQGKLPKSLQQLHHLVFDGAHLGMLPNGTPIPPWPMHVVVTITGRGNDFAQMHKDGTLNIGGAISRFAGDYVTGPTELTPQAVDPADLAKLQQGQVLDTDAATQIVTTVTFVGRSNEGKDIVVITSAVPGQGHHRSTAVYDRLTGLLVGFSFNNPFLNYEVRMTLTSTD